MKPKKRHHSTEDEIKPAETSPQFRPSVHRHLSEPAVQCKRSCHSDAYDVALLELHLGDVELSQIRDDSSALKAFKLKPHGIKDKEG